MQCIQLRKERDDGSYLAFDVDVCCSAMLHEEGSFVCLIAILRRSDRECKHFGKSASRAARPKGSGQSGQSGKTW